MVIIDVSIKLTMIELRDYQSRVRTRIYDQIRQDKRRILVMAPTGSGKSIIIAKIAQDALFRHKRVLIIVHRTQLLGQLESAIEHLCNHKPSIIAPGYASDYCNPIQIAMAQTLERRDLPPNIDILLGDESHITAYMDIWKQCLTKYCGNIWELGKTIVIGFTATPWRMRNREGFCHLFQRVVKAPSPRELIKLGYLTNPRLFTYDLLDTSELEINDEGDYTLSSLRRTCTSEYNKDVIEKWEVICSDKKTAVFCGSISQAEDLTQQLIDKGYVAECLHSKSGLNKDDLGETVFDRFKSGKTPILVSVGSLTEGFDETSIGCVVIARPTRSPALLTQIIGRGLRIHPGKTEVYILDCGGCIEWLTNSSIKGHKVEDPVDITCVPLCPKPTKREFLETKTCSCGAVLPIWARICPQCGKEFIGKEKDKPNNIWFPDLVEYFTEENYQQYTFLRSSLVKYYQNRNNPTSIFHKFHKRFGILAPRDYCLGAIFGLKNITENIAVYQNHLSQITNIDRHMIGYFIDLEFGEPGKSYNVAGNTYQRPDTIPSSFNPWQYLGVSLDSDESAIKRAYAEKIKGTSNQFALNHALTACLAAIK